MEIVLASASPRRKELLSAAGMEFTICASDCDEKVPNGLLPGDTAVSIASQKALNVAAKHPASTVIGADTIVVINSEILGKPKDEADAKRMLGLLSGNTHEVYTGVCIVKDGRETSFFECTEVTFYQLSSAEIDRYVSTGEPMDKAGAYGIQGKGALLVKGISGDYLNVVGLPVAKLAGILKTVES